MSNNKNADEKKYWLDNPRNINIIVWILYIICFLLFITDFFYEKKIHFDFENWLGFFAWYGGGMCVLLVLAAKVMRIFLKRDEDYYDR